MGIRRRRRKLTSLMSRLDQRVRAVELRPVNLLTTSQINAAVEFGTPAIGPETVVSASAPYQFRKIQDAYVYPKGLIGKSTDRVEIYLEADLGVEAGDRIEVSGIHWASSSAIDVDGDNFTVESIDTPPWTGRASYMHDPTQDQLSGVTISHAYYFQPETAAPTSWSSRRRLQTRRKVDSYSITGTTVTLTMNADHHFEVGDVIFVDIFSESSAAYGADGLFYVTVETSNTMQYELSAGVDTPTGTIDVSTDDIYVFPVAREWAQDGSIWVDSSNNQTYYWDGLRWVEYTPDASIGADGDPPSPPTSLSVTSSAALFGALYSPYAKVTLSWTAPTTSDSGDPLTDLAGYKVRWRRSTLEDWREKNIFDSTLTSYTLDDDANLAQGTFYYFELYAFDSGLQDSTAATATHTTSETAGDHTTYPPTDPTVTSRLGTITVAWDGNLDTGLSTTAAPDNITAMNIYMSTSAVFTPGPSNLQSTVRVFGADGGFDVLTDLTYSTSYYFRITVVDSAGVESSASGTVTAQVQPLVDADLIANTLTTWPFNGQVVSAGALADGSINASSLFGNDVVVQSAIAANAIGANEIAAGAIIAGKIGANAVTANEISAGSITAVKIATNAVEADKINAGAITAVKISAGAIEADKIAANAITSDKIAANSVTATKLESDLTLSNLIKTGDAGTARIEIRGKDHPYPGIVSFDGGGGTTFRFYSNGISYLDDVLVAGTLTGGIIRTSSSFPRLELNQSTASLRMRYSSSAEAELTNASWGAFIDGDFSVSGIATGNAYSYNIRGDAFTGTFVRGSLYSTSDERLKTDISNSSLGLDFVNSLEPVEFSWINDSSEKKNLGVIAQQVKETLDNNHPEFSDYFVVADGSEKLPNGEAAYGVQYNRFIPVLLNAVKELSSQVEELKSEVEYLKQSKDK